MIINVQNKSLNQKMEKNQYFQLIFNADRQ